MVLLRLADGRKQQKALAMADHWRTPHTDEEAFREFELDDMNQITRTVLAAIISGCICWLIGFGMGMVIS